MDRKEKAAARKAEIEACKAKAVTDKASRLASKALNNSIKVNKGKRKLAESNIDVVSTTVAKQVVSLLQLR
jgi:hypothetical protein